jgi:membrane protein required for colicin V production
MNWLDYLIIAVLLVSTFWSFRRGFILELFCFLALVLGVLVAVIFYPIAAPLFGIFLSDPELINIFSFTSAFVFSATALYLIGLFLHKFIHFIKLGFIDRTLGAFMGFLRGLVIVVVILVSMVATSGSNPPAYLRRSAISKTLVSLSKNTMDKIPLVFNNVKQDYGPRLEKWLKKVKDNVPGKD